MPILTGRHIFKNKAEFNGLVSAGVAFVIDDAATITQLLRQFEKDPVRRANIAKSARDYVDAAHERVDLAASAVQQILIAQK